MPRAEGRRRNKRRVLRDRPPRTDNLDTIESIMSHTVDERGDYKFLVKWKGNAEENGCTWELQDTLEIFGESVLESYFQDLDQRHSPISHCKPWRSKQIHQNSEDKSPPPQTIDDVVDTRIRTWKPPAGSWEDHITSIDECAYDDEERLNFFVTWGGGQKTKHEAAVMYTRCPQKVLQYYHPYVRIARSDEIITMIPVEE